MIHGIWFGPSAVSHLARTCMTTWSKSGYKLWDEALFASAGFEESRYFDAALEAQHWAAAADYARLAILFEHGGVYLDTDVQVMRPAELKRLYNKACASGDLIVGQEDEKWICNAVMIAPPRHIVIGGLLEKYQRMSLSETFDGVTNGVTLLTQACEGRADVDVLRSEVFYPWHWKDKDKNNVWKKERVTPVSICAHHWEGSWVKK